MKRQVLLLPNITNENIVTVNVVEAENYCDMELEDLKIFVNKINLGERVLFIFNCPDERKFFLNRVQEIVEAHFNRLTLADSIQIVNLITNNPFIYGNYRNMLVV